jgi:hypothetical protein
MNIKKADRNLLIKMQNLYLNKDFDDVYDYYEVEKIISRRNEGKNKLYLIKWFGYPIKDCTWEPISHLDKIKALVENFDKNFPYSKDKRQLRKYLHSINKRNKRVFRNKNKIKPKSFHINKINRNNHIIINLEDSTILDEKIHEETNTIDDSIVESIEISEEKNKDNNTEEGSLFELIDDNRVPKLIKPIIIW